ncbi:hypothetical protein GQX74_014871 [Glossina fuscipes]|nr:hypothetical protein GQX74_014871 [Glossina fuscipes]
MKGKYQHNSTNTQVRNEISAGQLAIQHELSDMKAKMCRYKADASGIPTIWPSILPKIDVVVVEVLPPVRYSDLKLSLDVGTATLARLLVSLLVEWQTLSLLLVIVLKFELCLLWQAIGLFVAVGFGFPLLLIFEFPLKLAKLVDTTVIVIVTIL